MPVTDIKIGSLTGRIDPDLLEAGLTRPEMLRITGFTVERLMAWYKRKSLPLEFLRTPGSGNRRRYSYQEILFLSCARILADAGLPIEDACIIASGFQLMIDFSILAPMSFLTLREAAEKLREYERPWVILIRRPEGWEPPGDINMEFVTDRYIGVLAQADDTFPKIREWMRDLGADYISILDIASVTAGICAGFKEVLATASE